MSTFENWEAVVSADSNTLNVSANGELDAPPEGKQYTSEAEDKIEQVRSAAAASLAASLIEVSDVFEDIPPPLEQVYSEKPNDTGGDDAPLIINTVTHTPGKWGEIIVGIKKAEHLEIPGIDLSLYPGLTVDAYHIREDAAAVRVYRWDMDVVELPSQVVFAIDRVGTGRGLPACAVCRIATSGVTTTLNSDDNHNKRVPHPETTGDVIQTILFAKEANFEQEALPEGFEVTAQIFMTNTKSNGEIEVVSDLVIAEKLVNGTEPAFDVWTRADDTDRRSDRSWVRIMRNIN